MYPEHSASNPEPQQLASLYVTKDEAVVVAAVVTSATVVAAGAAVVVVVVVVVDVVDVDAAVVAVDTADAVVDAGVAAALSDTCSQHHSNAVYTPSQQATSPPPP